MVLPADNPFEVLEAPIGPDPARPGFEAWERPPFFAVSERKLVIMSLVTFGLYQTYWFYRHFRAVREDTGENIWPFWRAIFAWLWSFSLFGSIKGKADEVGTAAGFDPGGMAIAFIVISALHRLPDPFWLVTLLAFLPLLPVQRAVNRIHAQITPHADKNDSFTGWNILAMVFGGLFLVLVCVGFMIPESEW